MLQISEQQFFLLILEHLKTNETRLLVSGQSPESYDWLLTFMKQ